MNWKELQTKPLTYRTRVIARTKLANCFFTGLLGLIVSLGLIIMLKFAEL